MVNLCGCFFYICLNKNTPRDKVRERERVEKTEVCFNGDDTERLPESMTFFLMLSFSLRKTMANY